MKSSYFKYLFTLFISCNVFGQDTLSVYNKIYNQIDPIRTFNKSYYYNPANMSDYSKYTFSDINLNYHNFTKEHYLLQDGKSNNKIIFNASSYAKQKNNQTIWGRATYVNEVINDVKWNNNLDLKRIEPIVMADSVGGKTTIQNYNFTGGYNKNFDRISWGIQLDYDAALSYKTKDPRPKNVISDLNIKTGLNYSINDKYKVGLFAGINRYIQTSTISFSSEVQRAALYQMNGLGNYNFYFSSRSNKSVFVDFKTNYGFTFGSTSNDFSLTFYKSNSNLKKQTFIDASSSAYEINKLNSNEYVLNVLKNFTVSNEILVGAKIDLEFFDRTGTETLYSNNSDVIQKILEKENYHFKTNKITYQLHFNYNSKKSNITVLPYFSQQKFNEKRIDNNTFQVFDKNIIGGKLNYLQQLSTKNSFNVQANFFISKTTSSHNNIDSNKNSIVEWLTNDFNVNTLDYKGLQTMLRYDNAISTKRSIYTIFAFDLYKFSDNKTNTHTGITVGLTF